MAYEYINIFLKWGTLIFEVIAFLSLIIPKTRKALGKLCRRISGYEELHNELTTIKEQVNKVDEKIASVDEKIKVVDTNLNDHIKLDELKLEGQMNGLKDSLLSSFHFYAEDRGYITLEEFDVLQDVYNSYIALNGNGGIKSRWENVICKLPSQPPQPKPKTTKAGKKQVAN